MKTSSSNTAEFANKQREMILQSLQLIMEPGQVVELRIPKARKNGSSYEFTVSGYFDDVNALAEAAMQWSGKAEAVYITLNPADSALLARAYNRVQEGRQNASTSDGNIIKRRWLLIDADAKRPAGISSSDDEHKAALDKAFEVRDSLRVIGWPDPIVADSGNGAHLLYRIDLPVDDGRLVERVLKGLAGVFNDANVQIDTSVFNPARICKLYGTSVKKGDNTPDRPHRFAKLIEVPDELVVVPQSLLEMVAVNEEQRGLDQKAKSPYSGEASGFNLDDWIRRYIGPIEPRRWKNGDLWILRECPFNPDHNHGEARILRLPEGQISAGCFHNSCTWGWRELREKFEPGCYDRKSKQSRKKKQEVSKSHPTQDLTSREEAESQVFPLTDLGNAERLIHWHGDNIRYCCDWKTWLIFNGVRWEPDRQHKIRQLAKDTVRRIYSEATDCSDMEERARVAKHALASESASRVKALLELAESETGIPVASDMLDQDQWLLNCQNGTLDLRTGILREPCKDDLITKCIPVDYDSNAQCPVWDSFLTRIMDGNIELIRFLQRVIGYTLTGSNREQVVFILYGVGANGKSTFLSAIGDLLGDYSKRVQTETLMKKKFNSIPTDLADLAGARFVTADETDEGQRLNEAQLKALCGGERIKCRRLYEREFDYLPEYKIFLACNHKPVIRGTDNGIWRRIRLIPFTVTIPDDLQDKSLPDKLRNELAGILRWAVEGCLAWQAEGLGFPPEVKEATEGYRAEMDTLAGFLSDCCIQIPSAKVVTQELYRAYKNWCEENGEHRVLSQKALGIQLQERGFMPGRDTISRYWSGIGLLVNPEKTDSMTHMTHYDASFNKVPCNFPHVETLPKHVSQHVIHVIDAEESSAPEPESNLDAEHKRYLLEWGKAHDWPELHFGNGTGSKIPAGELAWKRFVNNPDGKEDRRLAVAEGTLKQ